VKHTPEKVFNSSTGVTASGRGLIVARKESNATHSREAHGSRVVHLRTKNNSQECATPSSQNAMHRTIEGKRACLPALTLTKPVLTGALNPVLTGANRCPHSKQSHS